MRNKDCDQNQIGRQMRFKEIIAGIKSCFSLTANERLIIMLVLAIFLFGIALRWRHLKHEKPEPYEPPMVEMNISRK